MNQIADVVLVERWTFRFLKIGLELDASSSSWSFWDSSLSKEGIKALESGYFFSTTLKECQFSIARCSSSSSSSLTKYFGSFIYFSASSKLGLRSFSLLDSDSFS